MSAVLQVVHTAPISNIDGTSNIHYARFHDLDARQSKGGSGKKTVGSGSKSANAAKNAAKQSNKKNAATRNSCTGISECGPCIAVQVPGGRGNNACSFSFTTRKCIPRSNAVGLTQTAAECTRKEALLETLIVGQVNQDFTTSGIERHIFRGEANSLTAGRHMSKIWLKDNPTTVGTRVINRTTGLSLFTDGKVTKTTWNNNAEGGIQYTEADVKRICTKAMAIVQKRKARLDTKGIGLILPLKGYDDSLVIEAQPGVNLCVKIVTKTCFPLADPATLAGFPSDRLGTKCS